MKHVYDIAAGRSLLGASDVGWVVGHSYIVYGPLLHGTTTILYEGKPVGTPDPGAFWRVVSEHKGVALFTAPTAFRAIKKEDPEGKLLKHVRSLELPHAVPGGRALAIRRPRSGRRSFWASRSSITGGKPKPAGRSRQLRRHRGAAGQARLAVGAVAGLGFACSMSRAAWWAG